MSVFLCGEQLVSYADAMTVYSDVAPLLYTVICMTCLVRAHDLKVTGYTGKQKEIQNHRNKQQIIYLSWAPLVSYLLSILGLHSGLVGFQTDRVERLHLMKVTDVRRVLILFSSFISITTDFRNRFDDLIALLDRSQDRDMNLSIHGVWTHGHW